MTDAKKTVASVNPDRSPGEEWLETAASLLDDVPNKTRHALMFEVACGLRAAYEEGRRKGWRAAADHLINNAEDDREW